MAPDFEAGCKTKNKNLEIKEVFHTGTLFNQVKSYILLSTGGVARKPEKLLQHLQVSAHFAPVLASFRMLQKVVSDKFF